jgi:hypothetical protein
MPTGQAGVAVVGSIVASGGADLAGASRPAWWALAALGMMVLGLGALATGGRAHRSAQRVARQLNPEAVRA